MLTDATIQNIKTVIQVVLKGNLIAAYSYADSHHLLIILKKTDIASLDKLKALKKTFKNHTGALKIFSLNEFESSLDVFPMEFLEIFESHKLIAGEDILKNYTISKRNLRHECEFHLRSHTLKIREAYMHEYAYTDALIRDSFEGFLNVFKQLAKLKGMKKRYNSDEEFLKEFGEKIGFNPSIFIEVLQPENRKSSLKDLFPAYLEELTKITENVDKTEI